MRPRLSPEDQDLGSSATLYCYREQSGGGGGHAAASTEQENCGIDIDYRNVKDLHTTNSVEGALEGSREKIDRHPGAPLLRGVIEEAREPERMLQATAEKGVGVKACPGGRSKDRVIMAAVIPTKTSGNKALRDLYIDPADKNRFIEAVIKCSVDFPQGSRRAMQAGFGFMECGGRLTKVQAPGSEETVDRPYQLAILGNELYQNQVEPMIMHIIRNVVQVRDAVDGGITSREIGRYLKVDDDCLLFPVSTSAAELKQRGLRELEKLADLRRIHVEDGNDLQAKAAEVAEMEPSERSEAARAVLKARVNALATALAYETGPDLVARRLVSKVCVGIVTSSADKIVFQLSVRLPHRQAVPRRPALSTEMMATCPNSLA